MTQKASLTMPEPAHARLSPCGRHPSKCRGRILWPSCYWPGATIPKSAAQGRTVQDLRHPALLIGHKKKCSGRCDGSLLVEKPASVLSGACIQAGSLVEWCIVAKISQRNPGLQVSLNPPSERKSYCWRFSIRENIARPHLLKIIWSELVTLPRCCLYSRAQIIATSPCVIDSAFKIAGECC